MSTASKTTSLSPVTPVVSFPPVRRRLQDERHGLGPSGKLAGQSRSLSNKPLLIQTKLIIGEPDDKYEREADRVAKQVMRMNDPRDGGKAVTPVDPVSKVTGVNSKGMVAPPIVHEVLGSPGQPLDARTRAYMEPRFGHDFSRVRVHKDARSVESAQALNALAYTVGRDMVFGERQYAPATVIGQKLIAHELTHAAQQEKERQSKRNTTDYFDSELIFSGIFSRTSFILRKPEESSKATESIGKGLPEGVLRYLDKPILFYGNPSVTARIRVRGIDIQFPDGGKLYIDRSETPLDAVLIMQKLEKIEASMKWYIKILGPSIARESRVSLLAENELSNRLLIIRQITDGKNLKEIIAKLNYLHISNFEFISVSASIVPFIAGAGIGNVSTGAPSVGRAGMGRLTSGGTGKKVLAEATERAVGPVVVKVSMRLTSKMMKDYLIRIWRSNPILRRLSAVVRGGRGHAQHKEAIKILEQFENETGVIVQHVPNGTVQAIRGGKNLASLRSRKGFLQIEEQVFHDTPTLVREIKHELAFHYAGGLKGVPTLGEGPLSALDYLEMAIEEGIEAVIKSL
ncbi:MAG: DUF4157 domain-containing protein [Actinomycetota bacterium]|nr:DUF4157 domain-containing protein [Actinomycetota bacterium]